MCGCGVKLNFLCRFVVSMFNVLFYFCCGGNVVWKCVFVVKEDNWERIAKLCVLGMIYVSISLFPFAWHPHSYNNGQRAKEQDSAHECLISTHPSLSYIAVDQKTTSFLVWFVATYKNWFLWFKIISSEHIHTSESQRGGDVLHWGAVSSKIPLSRL
jgi:hypothetical protein